jgi:transcriptional regulator with XRE-family HTH domain
MIQLSDYGRNIEKRRKFLKLTQKLLADFAGISLRSLKSIENGSGNPTLKQITKVIDILGMQLTIEVK